MLPYRTQNRFPDPCLDVLLLPVVVVVVLLLLLLLTYCCCCRVSFTRLCETKPPTTPTTQTTTKHSKTWQLMQVGLDIEFVAILSSPSLFVPFHYCADRGILSLLCSPCAGSLPTATLLVVHEPTNSCLEGGTL